MQAYLIVFLGAAFLIMPLYTLSLLPDKLGQAHVCPRERHLHLFRSCLRTLGNGMAARLQILTGPSHSMTACYKEAQPFQQLLTHMLFRYNATHI